METRLMELTREDERYAYEAYEFLCESVTYTQAYLGRYPQEEDDPDMDYHINGEELLRGTCNLAVIEFGMMAATVFRQWGIRTTGDIGQIVFNLIHAELLSQSDRDNLDEFEDLFEIDKYLHDQFELSVEESFPKWGERMSWLRLRLLLAFVLFVGWLGWLAVAVYEARWQPEPVRIVSHAKLTAADHIVVANITKGTDGLPQTEVEVVEVISSTDPAMGKGPITVSEPWLRIGSGQHGDSRRWSVSAAAGQAKSHPIGSSACPAHPASRQRNQPAHASMNGTRRYANSWRS